jgi:hypothetical protein
VGEAVVAADQHTHAALAHLDMRPAGIVVDPRHALGELAALGRVVAARALQAVDDQREGRRAEDAVLDGFEHVERLAIAMVAVIDDVDSVPHRALDRFIGAGVRRGAPADHVRRLDAGCHLGIGHHRCL